MCRCSRCNVLGREQSISPPLSRPASVSVCLDEPHTATGAAAADLTMGANVTRMHERVSSADGVPPAGSRAFCRRLQPTSPIVSIMYDSDPHTTYVVHI